MNVSVESFFSEADECFQIQKLKIKLYMPEHYPSLLNDWEDILKFDYVGELEDAIENRIKLLSRISGREMDDDDGANDGEVDDLGSSAQKWRQEATDEIEYRDYLEDEVIGKEQSAGLQGVNDKANNEVKYVEDDTF